MLLLELMYKELTALLAGLARLGASASTAARGPPQRPADALVRDGMPCYAAT